MDKKHKKCKKKNIALNKRCKNTNLQGERQNKNIVFDLSYENVHQGTQGTQIICPCVRLQKSMIDFGLTNNF